MIAKWRQTAFRAAAAKKKKKSVEKKSIWDGNKTGR